MKKIAMFTMGTRGDVQPYIYLAQELNKNGYDTLLGSHPCWKQLIESSNIKFVPIGPDIDIEKEAAIIRGKNKNPMLSMLKTMNYVFDIIVESTGDVFEACKGMDLIVVSHAQMGATEAEVLGIPTVNATIQPEMIPEKLKKKTFINRVIVQGFQKSLEEYKLPNSMIAIGSVPHSYLFDKCKMVIHHCGFGTSAATLIYGIPSIPVPHVLDQKGQADMLRKLGVASEEIDGHNVTEDRIISCIKDMELHYEERYQKAKLLSEKIKKEKGLEVAVRYIGEII